MKIEIEIKDKVDYNIYSKFLNGIAQRTKKSGHAKP